MADIPGSNPQPSVEPRATPAAFDDNRVSPEDYGAGSGAALEHHGAEAGAASLHALQQNNAAVAESLFGRAQKVLNDVLTNPESGFESLRGADATANADKFVSKFTGGIEQIRQQLTPAQKRIVGYHLDRLQQEGLLRAAHWERTQFGVVADAGFRGSEAEAVSTLAQLAGDPTTTKEEMDAQLRKLMNNGINRAHFKYGDSASTEAIKSETLPLLNNAAVKAMNEAVSTGDPQHAERTMSLFGPYLGVHAKMYTGAVEKMLAQQTVNRESERILGGSIDVVPLPDGGSIARVNEGLAATRLANRPADEHSAEIQKAVNARVSALDAAWKKTVAQVAGQAQREGDPDALGQFDMTKVNKVRREWLQQHDEPTLIALAQLQNREDARERAASRAEAITERAEQRSTSEANYNAAWRWLHDEDNRPAILKMSQDEFARRLIDDAVFPGGLGKKDRANALAEFDKMQKLGNKLDEPLPTTVKDVVNEAFADAHDRDMSIVPSVFRDKYTALLRAAAEKYVAAHKGEVDTEKLRTYLRAEMVEGKVKDATPGSWWGYNDADALRVEAEAKYQGKKFLPRGAADDAAVTLGAEAPPPPSAPSAPQPSPQDAAAVEWLKTHGSDPAAEKVRAKLKAKGLLQ